jgi:hypothetical protein
VPVDGAQGTDGDPVVRGEDRGGRVGAVEQVGDGGWGVAKLSVEANSDPAAAARYAGAPVLCPAVTGRRRVGRPSIGLATPQAAPLQISSL